MEDEKRVKRNYERYLEGETFGGDSVYETEQNPYEVPQNQNRPAEMPRNVQQTDNSCYGLEEPVSMGEWLLTYLLMCVPCVNIIMMFVWAFGSGEKKSKSNYFKATLIVMGVVIVLEILFMVLFAGLVFSMQ